jgi:hypothetical protein
MAIPQSKMIAIFRIEQLSYCSASMSKSTSIKKLNETGRVSLIAPVALAL